MTESVDAYDAAERLRGAVESNPKGVITHEDVRAVLDERDQVLEESAALDREHHNYRATVLVLGDLLGLAVPSDDGSGHLETRARVDAWARTRRAERRGTESLTAIAHRRGIPREVLDPDRSLGDRLVAVIVTELRAAGWRAPDEDSPADAETNP